MKIVLSSRGSRGDVNPIIEVASGFQHDGHDVSICVPELFRKEMERRNLKSSYYPEDSKELMVGLGSGIKSISKAMAFFSKALEEQFNFMLDATKDADVLITSVNEMAAPTVAEFRNIPYYRIGFAPILPGNQTPPLFPWQNLPSVMNRMVWTTINGMAGILIRKFINAKRSELGLNNAPGANQYFTGKSHTLLAISQILAPPCKSWEKRYQYDYTGYCFPKTRDGLDQPLLDFIEAGDPPLYIGFGSVTLKDPDRLTTIIENAVEKAGCRVILGQGWTGLGNGKLHDRIFTIGESCHASLFPKMAGIIHHGGSGTVHSAAQAGIPQFILPQIIDQYYWGNRIYKLGLGPKPVFPKKVTTDILARALEDFAHKEIYKQSAQSIAESLQKENGVKNVVEIISLQSKYRRMTISSAKKSHPYSNHVAC